MDERVDTVTLYLRGGDVARLRDVLKPFGNGGDLERWRLDAWDAEVVLGRGAEVALIRVPQSVDAGSLRTLIIELHQAADEAGLVLSDDVHSRKSAQDLIRNFGLESGRLDARRTDKPANHWSMPTKIAFLVGVGVFAVLVYVVGTFLSDLANRAP